MNLKPEEVFLAQGTLRPDLIESASLVASGKASTPTDTGIRVVSNIETYPYRTASPKTRYAISGMPVLS